MRFASIVRGRAEGTFFGARSMVAGMQKVEVIHAVAGPLECHAPATLKAGLIGHIFQEFEMSRPNVDDVIEKVKQLRRLDGMLWSGLDFQNPVAIQGRTKARMAPVTERRRYLQRAQTPLEAQPPPIGSKVRVQGFILVAIGVVCIAVFAWSLTGMCSQQTIARAANWLSTLSFALLGPMWSLQVASSAGSSRMIAGFSTVLTGFFGAMIAPPFEFACR
jgi:hypothetical protein